MKTMKRIYKKSDMVVWEDEKNTRNNCHFYSLSEYNWIAVVTIDNLDTTIGEYSSRNYAFRMLQIAMEKLDYTIEL